MVVSAAGAKLGASVTATGAGGVGRPGVRSLVIRVLPTGTATALSPVTTESMVTPNTGGGGSGGGAGGGSWVGGGGGAGGRGGPGHPRRPHPLGRGAGGGGPPLGGGGGRPPAPPTPPALR